MQISRFTPSYGVLLHCCWPAGAMEAAAAAASFLLRSFGASNLKRAAFFFDYKEFLANGGTVGGLLCQQFISSILFVRHKLLMELFPNLRSTVLYQLAKAKEEPKFQT